MKFWELLQRPARPRDPTSGRLVAKAGISVDKEDEIRRLARVTDYLSPAVKELSMMLAKSDLTTVQAEQLVSQHKQRDDILRGYHTVLKAMRLRRGRQAHALLKRKGELP